MDRKFRLTCRSTSNYTKMTRRTSSQPSALKLREAWWTYSAVPRRSMSKPFMILDSREMPGKPTLSINVYVNPPRRLWLSTFLGRSFVGFGVFALVQHFT